MLPCLMAYFKQIRCINILGFQRWEFKIFTSECVLKMLALMEVDHRKYLLA